MQHKKSMSSMFWKFSPNILTRCTFNLKAGRRCNLKQVVFSSPTKVTFMHKDTFLIPAVWPRSAVFWSAAASLCPVKVSKIECSSLKIAGVRRHYEYLSPHNVCPWRLLITWESMKAGVAKKYYSRTQPTVCNLSFCLWRASSVLSLPLYFS